MTGVTDRGRGAPRVPPTSRCRRRVARAGRRKVGEILRADADFDLDGVTIVGLSPIQEKKRNEAERIEIIGPPRRDEELVTSSLVKGGRARSRSTEVSEVTRERPRRRDRAGPSVRPRGPDRAAARDKREATRRRGRPSEPTGRHAPNAVRRVRDRKNRRSPSRSVCARPVHRSAVLEELPPEHRPIAEQVLAGDIPAVRQAIDKENEARKERGEPAIDGNELLALAEKLRPRLRTAEWRDRAEAALADVDEIDLRDLRSVVVAADSAARDDDTRALAAQLRESLAHRVDSEQAVVAGRRSRAHSTPVVRCARSASARDRRRRARFSTRRSRRVSPTPRARR